MASSEGGFEIATTACEIGDARIAEALAAAAEAAGMSARIDSVEDGVRVTLEHAASEQSRADNLVEIYRRLETAGLDWRVLDLIVQRPTES